MNPWTLFGKSSRYYIWQRNDGHRDLYQVTVLEFEPTTKSGYYDLGALLSIKGEFGGYKRAPL